MLTARDAAAIGGPSRDFRLALDVRVVDSGVTYWCEITKRFPWRHPYDPGLGEGEQDPGVQRVIGPPDLEFKGERTVGQFSAQPVTVQVRNDDGFWNRTKGIWLIDPNGTQRWLLALKRARVRFRWIDLAAREEFPSEYTYHMYIDKIVPKGAAATVTFQPLDRLLMTGDPSTIKSGDRWFQDCDTGELVERIVRAAIPDVVFEAGSPPRKIFIDARPGFGGTASAPLRLGPVIDNLGRQPERIAGALTFDREKIPTYNVESYQYQDIQYYAVTNSAGVPELYEYTVSTGDSRLIYSGSAGFPIAWMMAISPTQILFCEMSNSYPSGISLFNRASRIKRINTDGTGLTAFDNTPRWSFCDAFIHACQTQIAAYEIGTKIPQWATGEMILEGFPQETMGIAAGWVFGVLPYSYKQLKQTYHPHDSGELPGDGSAIRIYDQSGWTPGIDQTYPWVAWNHLNPFPFPIQHVRRLTKIVWVEWRGGYGGLGAQWYLGQRHLGTGSVQAHKITFPDPTIDPPDTWDGNTLRQYQPTGWTVVSPSSADAYLGTPSWVILATVGYRQALKAEGANVCRSQLWKIDLNATPHPTNGWSIGYGLSQIYVSAPEDDAAAPWPRILDMIYLRSHQTGAKPLVIGCYLDGKTRTYQPFHFDLESNSMNLSPGGNAPVSGAPLVGWAAYDGQPNAGLGDRRVFFRDCGSGGLWECLSGQTYRLMGGANPVDDIATWEAVPKLTVVENATTPAASRILGFSAPSAPIWARPWNANGMPKPSPAGSYRLWSLGSQLTARVPIADFRKDLVKNSHEALQFLDQALGPGWLFGHNPLTGQFAFKEHPDGDPELTLVPANEGRADWSQLEVPVIDEIEREDETGDDVINSIVVTPWAAITPEVSCKPEMVPRQTDAKIQVVPTPSTTTESAVKVCLNCIRDGIVGTNDQSVYTSEWDTTLLFGFAINVEDILAELKEPASNLASIKVRGMGPDPTGYSSARSINGALIIASHDGLLGDFITLGDGPTGYITGFVDPDTILTAQCGSPDVTVPAGTTVRIQPRSGSGLMSGSEGGGLPIQGGITAVAGTIYAAHADRAHKGDVLAIENELVLILEIAPLIDPGSWTHYFTVQRGYLGTAAVAHSASAYLCEVYLHPRDSLPHPIGDSGLTIAFNYDPASDFNSRTFKSGDRIILEFPGVRAEPSKWNMGIAEGAESQAIYGKRGSEDSFKKNPYVSQTLAPHLAYAWLQELQWPGVTLRVPIPLAFELPAQPILRLRSTHTLPDETNHEMDFRIRSFRHSYRNRSTQLQVISRSSAAVSAKSRGAGTGEVLDAGIT